jgi:fumarylacetoacetate (FAA) hydrolase
MKLATLKGGTRDGKLVVVSKDLTRYCAPDNIASTLQAALDDWANTAPKLEVLARDVDQEAVPCERFHERQAHSPLPRAYQWADDSPTSTTSKSCERRGMPRCRQASTKIR